MSSCLRLVVLSPRIFCFLVFLDVSRFLCHVREDADSVSGFSWVTKGVSHLSDPPYHLLLQCIYFSIFVQMLTFSDCLRVEFLLKTDSGYPRDAEVILFDCQWFSDSVFFLEAGPLIIFKVTGFARK